MLTRAGRRLGRHRREPKPCFLDDVGRYLGAGSIRSFTTLRPFGLRLRFGEAPWYRAVPLPPLSLYLTVRREIFRGLRI